jgi:hypothetical protein
MESECDSAVGSWVSLNQNHELPIRMPMANTSTPPHDDLKNRLQERRVHKMRPNPRNCCKFYRHYRG